MASRAGRCPRTPRRRSGSHTSQTPSPLSGSPVGRLRNSRWRGRVLNNPLRARGGCDKKKGAFVALSTRRKPRRTHSPTAGPSTFAGAEGSLWPVASVPQRGQTLSHARSLFAERPREDESMGWHLRHVALSAASPHPRSFADGPGTSWKEKRGKTQNQHSWRPCRRWGTRTPLAGVV